MSQYYYDGLRDAYHLIVQKQQKNQSESWYSGRGTYRTTASGRKVRWDEDDEQDNKTSDYLNKKRQETLAKAGRERLKKKGAVPTKQGSRMFEAFMKEAMDRAGKSPSMSDKDEEYMKQVYLSARALDFKKWIMFVTEML